MKAITLWQPWASLIAIGAKRYETRAWETDYRGTIAIHASARRIKTVLRDVFPLGEWDYAPGYAAKQKFLKGIAVAFEDYAPIEDAEEFMEELPLGQIVGIAQLVECHCIAQRSPSTGHIVTDKGVIVPTGDELLFGNWTPGRFAWELRDVRRLKQPIPARGGQRLWNWEPPAEWLKEQEGVV